CLQTHLFMRVQWVHRLLHSFPTRRSSDLYCVVGWLRSRLVPCQDFRRRINNKPPRLHAAFLAIRGGWQLLPVWRGGSALASMGCKAYWPTTSTTPWPRVALECRKRWQPPLLGPTAGWFIYLPYYAAGLQTGY